MNSQTRFLETMGYGQPDRAPVFEEGIRDGVLPWWQNQGLPVDKSLDELFSYDQREEITLDLLPNLDFGELARRKNGLEYLEQKLDEQVEERLPEDWQEKLAGWQNRQHTLMLMAHWGLFEAIGIEDGRTFIETIYLMVDRPNFIKSALMILGQFAARLTDKLLAQTSVDALLFSEPIGGHHGALISPDMYRQYGLASYQPILDVANRRGVETIIWRTYANTRGLLRPAVEAGMNCLWACECNPDAMDYLDIRAEFGRDLRLIGGIDVDLLRQTPVDIYRELERVLPPLLAQGGYAPLADGRVRPDIPYKGYVAYRERLQQIVMG